jgi:hypothetical protein
MAHVAFLAATAFTLATIAFFLWTEHRAHLFGALPYLFVLACPLMHLFMHHGKHGGGHDHQETQGGGSHA